MNTFCWCATLLGLAVIAQARESVPVRAVGESVATPSRAAARYRDGSISAADLESWQAYLRANGRPTNRDFAINNLVVVRTLARRFDRGTDGSKSTSAERASHRVQREYRARQAANQRLDKALAEASELTEAAIRADFDADPTRYRRPKRWRLSNIFLRLPPESPADARVEARERLEVLRARALAGADFAELARAESQSETRLRGGDMGFVALDRLHPAVARAVTHLAVDELSAVIDTEDGVTLLRCTAVLEPRSQTFVESRSRVESRLREKLFERLQAELDERLVEALSRQPPRSVSPRDSQPPSKPSEVGAKIEVRYRLDGAEHTLTTDAVTAFLRLRGIRKPIESFTGERRAELVRERLLHEARAQEARRRGLLDNAAYRDALIFHDLEIRAQLVANRASERALREPTSEAIRAFYDQRRTTLVQPRGKHLRSIVVARDAAYGARFFHQLRASAERLASAKSEPGPTAGPEAGAESSAESAVERRAEADGRTTDGDLESLARAFGARAELRDHGWLGDQQIWQLGLNIDAAVAGLEVGGISPLVQQSSWLYVFELLAERPERQLGLDEARPRIRAALLAAERRRVGDALRKQVLAEQEIEVVEVSEVSE